MLASARDLDSERDLPDLGFPRQARLTEPRDFQRVFAGAKRLGDRYFTVLAAPNEAERPRLGLAVSRRNAPRAVDRNRLKRLVRESFRHAQAHLKPLDIVVIPKPGAREASAEALTEALTQHWKRLYKA